MKKRFINFRKLGYTVFAFSGLISSVSAQSVDNPTDMTNKLANPDFEIGYGNVPGNGGTVRDLPYGWQHFPAEELVPKDSQGTPAWGITGGGQTSGTNLCWYNSVPMPEDFLLYQEISGLEEGLYVVSCDLCAMGNTDDMKTTQRLFANNVVQYYGSESDYSQAQLTDNNEIRSFAGHTWMANNLGGGFVLQPMSVTVHVKNGETLKLGIKTSRVLYDGTMANNAAGFFKVDNFKLECIATLSSAKGNLQENINNAENFLNSTESGIYDGQYPIAAYNTFKQVIDDTKNFLENNDVITIENLIEKQDILLSALETYKETQIHDTYTYLIINNDFENTDGLSPDPGSQVYRHDPPGWNRTGEIIGNSKGINPEGEGRHGTFTCWYNSFPMPEFELSQTIKAKSEENPDGIPAGNYEISCLMWTDNITTQRLFANNYSVYYGKQEDYDKNIAEGENYSFAGLAPLPGNVVLQQMVLPFALGEGEDLKLGIKTNNIKADGTAETTSNAGWFRTDYFRLQYKGVDNLSLNETDAYSNQFNKATVCNVNLKRNIKSGKWNTICLPFSLNKEQSAEYFSDIRKLNGVSMDSENYILNFSEKLDEMEAGVPYLVKGISDISEMEFENVTVEQVDENVSSVSVTDGNVNVTMTGNYSPVERLENVYFISGNKFYFADSGSNVRMNGFRAFITINGNQILENSPVILNIDGNHNDGTTNIVNTVTDYNSSKPIYNLNGQRITNDSKRTTINSLPKGIYIINGKKFIK